MSRRLLKRKIKRGDQPALVEPVLRATAPTPLTDRTVRGRASENYVAMTKHGWGVHKLAYDALLLCADKLPENLHKKPVQVAFYLVDEDVEPKGFDTWDNGDKPRFVGLMALNRKGTR